MTDTNRRWNLFPPEIRAAFERARVSKRYKRGDILYRTGEIPEGVYSVTAGLVGLTYVGVSGREYLLRLCSAGQFLSHRSLIAGETYHATAVILEDSEIDCISKKDFFKIFDQYPTGYRIIVQSLAQELRQAELRIASMSEKDVTARVAEALIYLKNAHPGHKWTRREIAEFCGSTTPTVIKVLSRLAAADLIAQTGRSISLVNQRALLQLSHQHSPL